jgi:phosphatidate cytidylyltransferase
LAAPTPDPTTAVLLGAAAVFGAGAASLAAGRALGRGDPRAWGRYAVELAVVAWVLVPAALGGTVWASVVAVTAAACGAELARLVPSASRGGRPTLVAAACAVAALTARRWPSAIAVTLACLALLGFSWDVLRGASRRLGAPSPVSLLLPLASAVALVRAGAEGAELAPVAFLFGVVEGADAFAYIVGSAFGRTPFAPSVSPKKTREGALASLLAGAAIGAGLSPLLPATAAVGAAAGLALGAGAVLADLATSVLKRRAGSKDFAAWVPHHGGVFDVYDSLVVLAPAWLACSALVPLGLR